MAEKKATLLVELKDKASKGLGSIKGSWLAITAAIGAAVVVIAKAVKAAADHEVVVNRLGVALKNQGVATDDVRKDLERFADQQQKVSTFSNTAILDSQGLLVSYGLLGDELKTTTKSAMDLASGMNIDLKTATMLLGRAAAGETGTLSRYGIAISDAIPPGEKLAEVQRIIADRFGGQAQAATDTYAGKVAQLTNTWGDFQRSIGETVIPILVKLMDSISFMVDEMGTWQDAIKAFGGVAIEIFRAVTVGTLELLSKIPGIGKAFQRVADWSNTGFDQLQAGLSNLGVKTVEIDQKIVESARGRNLALEADDQKRRAEEAAKHEADMAKMDEDTAVMIEKLQTRAEQEQFLTETFGQQRADFLSTNLSAQEAREVASHVQRLKAAGKFNEARLVEEQAVQKAIEEEEFRAEEVRKELAAKRVQNFQETLSTIATMSSSNNKTLSAIGKAAALVRAKMNIAEGITRALAAAPPPWNIALAAMTGAAGAVQIAQIAGMKMARGGMVLPRRGGTSAIIGEAGKKEAVIPLDDDRTKEALQDTLGGGGGLTININAGTVIADRMSVREFAREIDQELFRLRQNNQSIAFERASR